MSDPSQEAWKLIDSCRVDDDDRGTKGTSVTVGFERLHGCVSGVIAERDVLYERTKWRFPIMRMERYRGPLRCPRSVPWGLLAPQEQQALDNHDQSLRRLAERGGLAPCEAVAVIEGRRWRAMSDEDAIDALLGHLHTYESSEVVQLRAENTRLRAELESLSICPNHGVPTGETTPCCLSAIARAGVVSK